MGIGWLERVRVLGWCLPKLKFQSWATVAGIKFILPEMGMLKVVDLAQMYCSKFCNTTCKLIRQGISLVLVRFPAQRLFLRIHWLPGRGCVSRHGCRGNHSASGVEQLRPPINDPPFRLFGSQLIICIEPPKTSKEAPFIMYDIGSQT